MVREDPNTDRQHCRRSFLFLQTIASPFFLRLGQRLADNGCAVSKINFNGGDHFFWNGFHEINFTDKPAQFQGFLEQTLDQKQVTDIVLFGDCRPWHQKAISLAKSKGISIWVFEEGYIRPHWITLEQGGVNGHSSFPKQADIIHALADKAVLEAPEPVGGGLWQRIFYDFVYNFMNLLMIWKFPHHRTHRPYTVWAEYATWTKRLVTLSWLKPRAEKAVREIADMAAPCYLFPLQLDSDSQVRVHSPYGTMPDAIRTVLKTFASEAPKDAVLIIKNHPLDNGMINYGKLIRAFAAEQAIKDRVRFIDGGDLNALLAHCRGVITINSTVGMTALDKKVPVLLLGDAIYNIPGLVYRSGQTEFWTDPKSPDLSLLDALRTSLLGYCHANGNFYTRTGMELAVTHSLPRLTQPTGL